MGAQRVCPVGKFAVENMPVKTETLGKDVYINAAKTAMTSKIVGRFVLALSVFVFGTCVQSAQDPCVFCSDSDFFSKLVVDAVLAVKVRATPSSLAAGPAVLC